MKTIFIVILMLLFGAASGWFQYWMAAVLDRRRWLLWFQPTLFGLIGLCFLAWTLSLDGLEDSLARWACTPFFALLLITLIGWALGCRRRKQPPRED